MNDPRDPRQAAGAGLCASCRHADAVATDRGRWFTLCRLSKTDDRFPRYPILPVRACGGYVAQVG
jgi:hypothetical protein